MKRVVIFETYSAIEASDTVNDFIRESCGKYDLVNASTSVFKENNKNVYVTTIVYETRQ